MAAVAAVVEDELLDSPPAEESAAVAAVPVLAPVPVATVEVAVPAVVAAAELGRFDAISGGFWVFLPKLRITAATTIAATANPSQTERFTEPRNRPVTRP